MRLARPSLTRWSEWAVTGSGHIDSARLPRRHQLDGNVLRDYRTLVPDDVRVSDAAVINECHTRGVDMRSAAWVIPFIVRQRSRCHDDEAMARVIVPPSVRHRLPG